MSDQEITVSCEINKMMSPGNSLMADKGFTVNDVCEENCVKLDMPPFIHTDQLSTADWVETRRIALYRFMLSMRWRR